MVKYYKLRHKLTDDSGEFLILPEGAIVTVYRKKSTKPTPATYEDTHKGPVIDSVLYPPEFKRELWMYPVSALSLQELPIDELTELLYL